jgi:hypothetical protein
MSSASRGRVTARRIVLLALAGGALAVGSAGVALAQQPQVINAGTDAQDAADALNAGCVDLAKCSWQQTSATTAWGPWKIVGDKLYNCSSPADGQGAEALTATNVTQSRGESTSVSERLSVEVSLGFLNLASTSLTATGFSQQEQGYTTSVSSGASVPVSPGYVGWAETQIKSNLSTGTASITDGIHLMTNVTGIDTAFPVVDPNTGSPDVQRRTLSTPMTTTVPGSTSAGEYETYCIPILAQASSATNSTSASGAMVARAATAARLRAPRPKRFKLTICHPKRPSGASSHRDRCRRRYLKGLLPKRHHMHNVTATLERAGHVHAKDRDRRGGIRLTQHRDIIAGHYRLSLKKKKQKNVIFKNDRGKKLYRGSTQEITVIPVTVRWKQKR